MSEHNIQALLSGHGEFVRVGKGKYGLAEWGIHDDGNVANAVRRILINHKHPMRFVDISEEVLKTWEVQKSAIIAAIDNDARFSKTNDGKVWLTETGLTIERKIKRDDTARWDRLMIVMRDLGTPMPVRIIVEAHNSSYPERPLTLSAVRYMMNRKPDVFVHTGQDEFGLVEWGSQPFQNNSKDRTEEILEILQQHSPLTAREIHNLYNQAHPERPVSRITIGFDLKKIAGKISSPKRGVYKIND